MRNLIGRGVLLFALLAAGLWWEFQVALAEEESHDAASNNEPSSVLVLKTGQLVEGNIRQNAGGYVVDLPKGSYLVPFDRVSVVADSRHEAYKKLKAVQKNPTPAFQVELARWCIGWKLFDEARVELRDALVADPNHEGARRMYLRLDRLMHPDRPAPEEKPQPKTQDGFEATEPESLSGLSPDAAKQYVIRVQPLLLNRCGNAGCHSPSSKQEFQITHMRRGLNRRTLQNLEAVLRYVDPASPDDSPLLKIPSGTHGRNGRPIFYGSIGEDNLKTLKDWVALAAKDLSTDPKDKPKPDPFTLPDPLDAEPDETLIRGVPEPPKPLSPEEQTEREKEDRLEEILKNKQPDAFDPEEFNRKYGLS